MIFTRKPDDFQILYKSIISNIEEGMKLKELEKLIVHGESDTVEFKSNFNSQTIETLVAFANLKGGAVFIGVSDNGEIIGVSINPETTQQWINEIKT